MSGRITKTVKQPVPIEDLTIARTLLDDGALRRRREEVCRWMDEVPYGEFQASESDRRAELEALAGSVWGMRFDAPPDFPRVA